MKSFSVLTAALSIQAAALVLAHHTVAYSYDVSRSVTLTGVVTSVEWKNPHVIYHLNVADSGGDLVDWEVESRHLQGMRQSGLEQNTIKVGDTITMNVVVALDGSRRAATISLSLPDGR